MYLKERVSVHALNPCPPCLCCLEGMWRDDFQAKVRKLVPLEKITDCEVQEAGYNELVPPGCMCPPACNPVSMEVPISMTMVNTAGSQGHELVLRGVQEASEFRRFVMDLKQKGPGAAGPA